MLCKSLEKEGFTVTRKLVGIDTASHAGGAPHLGRSALDAVELMSVGVNYLREHIIPEARVHYAYQDAGGTTVDFYTEAGYSDYESNNVLAGIMDEAFHELGAPEWENEDFALAKKFSESIDEKSREDLKTTIIKRYGEELLTEKLEKPLDTTVSNYDAYSKHYEGGSCIGQKGMLHAAKVVALASVKVLEQPEKLEEAKKEFLLKNNGVYRCPVGKDVKPPKSI